MDKTKPLTMPQRLLLAELIRRGPQPVSNTFAPAKALVTLGYAEWRGQWKETLAATAAGEAYYEKATSK